MAATASEATREIDWYVITDEADLTLRIADGLQIGEDRWGELTLNHPVAAHRWLAFSIDDNGTLWCRPCRRDVVIELQGERQEQLQLQAGDPIALPHNRVHISDSFRCDSSEEPAAVVRCVEVDDVLQEQGAPTLGQVVITESDLEAATDRRAADFDAALDTALDEARDEDRDVDLDVTELATEFASIPEPGQEDAAVVRATQPPSEFHTTLADRISERSSSLSMRSTRSDDSIETALIPVDAESPFAANEVSEGLRRPIDVSERRPLNRAANAPLMTPALAQQQIPTGRSYTYLWTLSAILGVGILAAIVVAITSANGRGQNPEQDVVTIPAMLPASGQTPTRTEQLLVSVQSIIAQSGRDDPAAWEFAVRSYEYILAQEPGNEIVRRRLAAARSRLAELQAGIVPSSPQPGAMGNATAGSSSIGPAAPSGIGPQRRPPATSKDPALATALTPQLPSLPAKGELLSGQQIATRLELARARLAKGDIVAPGGSSASALILSVLAADPGNREAINLLNASADLMVSQAEQAFADGDTFQARNTLEEVLAFHPRHGGASARWLEWTGAPSPYQ